MGNQINFVSPAHEKSWAFFLPPRKPSLHRRSTSEPGRNYRDNEGKLMTRSSHPKSGQPSLTDLMVRFLATRSDAASGVAVESCESEVEPHEVATGFLVDARVTWTDATAPLAMAPTSPPADWSILVAQPTVAFAVPMAAGNYPQRVKDLHPLLTRFVPTELRPSGEQQPIPGLSGLRTWIVREAKKDQPQAHLLAAGVARLLGEMDWAASLLTDAKPRCTDELQPRWENESAALSWHRGEADLALAAWERLESTPAIALNRGMARLFLGEARKANADLQLAIDQLPESSGWAELARLYLAVAEIHG